MHDDVYDGLSAADPVLAEILDTMPEESWTRAPAPGEWSIAEVIGHILAADSIWRPRILLTLVHEGVAWPDIDERALQEVLDAGSIDLRSRVWAHALARAELCYVLASLDADQWKRTFRHSKLGDLSVLAAAQMVIDHEAEHLAQLRQLRAAVQ